MFMKITARLSLYFLLFCGFHLSVNAQKHKLRDHLDSMSAFKALYFTEGRPDILRGIDSTLNNIEQYNFIQRDESEYLNLGNIGTAAYPILYDPLKRRGFQAGFDPFDLYWERLDSIRYFELKRPFTELSMNIGLRQELNFSGRHSQNIKDRFNFGIHFNRIFSVGYFQRQRATDNGFSVYGRYTTKNNRFMVLTALALNSFRVQENGGVAEDFINDRTGFITKQEASVRLLNAESFYRDIHWKIGSAYRLGYKYQVQDDDSVMQDKVQPLYSIDYYFGIGRDRYSYTDKSPDTLNYEIYYQGRDSASLQYQNRRISNEVSFRFLGFKKVAGAEGRPINIVAGVSLLHENYELSHYIYEKTFNNLSVNGYIRSNALTQKRWTYQASGTVYLSGYNLGDVEVKGGAGYNFKKLGSLQAQGFWTRRAPSWMEDHWHSCSLNFHNEFARVNTVGFNFAYTLPLGSYSLTKAEVKYYVVNNLIYWNTNNVPVQLNSAMSIFNLQVTENLAYKHFHFDNYVSLQLFSKKDLIRVPMIFTKHSFYYENYVFKRALLARIGFDVRYMTDFYANAYSPLTGQFYQQDKLKMHYLPMLDVFINLRIKTVRVFLKGNNLLQGVGTKGYYSAYMYPADERSFKFGVTWRFLD